MSNITSGNTEQIIQLDKGTFGPESTVAKLGATQVRFSYNRDNLVNRVAQTRIEADSGKFDAKELVQVRFENAQGQRIELPHEADSRITFFAGSTTYRTELLTFRAQTGGNLLDSWRVSLTEV